MTLQEAKDSVCLKKYNHYFNMSFRRSTAEIIEIMDEAATLYAKSKFEEAVEEMRAISELDSDVELPTFEA